MRQLRHFTWHFGKGGNVIRSYDEFDVYNVSEVSWPLNVIHLTLNNGDSVWLLFGTLDQMQRFILSIYFSY